MFAEQGLDAQVEAIAGRAGVGVGTVYRHFATKDALVEALVVEHFARLIVIAREQLELDDPWEAFAGQLRRGAEAHVGERALAQVHAARPELRRQVATRTPELLELGRELVDRAQAAGRLRPDFEVADISSVMCGLAGLAETDPVCMRRHLEFVLDGLRASPA